LGCDMVHFRKEIGRVALLLRELDCIFVSDEVLGLGLLEFSSFRKVIRVPSINFRGYHPDLCYVSSGERNVKTPLDDYHSILCVAAFKKGLNESSTLSLYNHRIFETAGYFAVWESEKSRLTQTFRDNGYEISPYLRRWTMRGAFMHTVNHPTIECLYDVAAVASAKAGRPPALSGIRPHDNLCYGPIFPVYDEIGEALGIEGSYLFKPHGKYTVITLEQFIATSFEIYRQHDPAQMTVWDEFLGQYTGAYNSI